eukprot:TRINITY_DN14772_c0_g1_i1.p1 TRINITY_DN14772_c0_g1~~TRINITY_DN14772_c0_g1_i1.p1  ORF type:complete len:357 (+),score=64.84 TRINITY_DN14772_c0_g1_i1:101-1171(+)
MSPLRILLHVALAMAVHGEKSPLIGMFSLPGSITLEQRPSPLSPPIPNPCNAKDQDCEVLPASYVKFIESAGGQVVPVSYASSDDEIDHLVDSLNGFLFTGGPDVILPSAAIRVLNRSKALFVSGGERNTIPVWGTCLGFEWLIQAVAGPQSLETGYKAFNVSFPLLLRQPAASKSRLLGEAPQSILEALTLKKTAFNSHERGISPARWEKFPALRETFQLLSTSTDLIGQEFVSVIEGAKGLPWFGTQWHPEKNIFEHGRMPSGAPFEDIPHSADAVAVAQYTANFFVNQARKNMHKFENVSEETARLIDGRSTSRIFAPAFDEVYILDSPATVSKTAQSLQAAPLLSDSSDVIV